MALSLKAYSNLFIYDKTLIDQSDRARQAKNERPIPSSFPPLSCALPSHLSPLDIPVSSPPSPHLLRPVHSGFLPWPWLSSCLYSSGRL